MSLIKVTPDRERIKSILEMTNLIQKRINILDKAEFSSLIIVDYYEIIKELITAFLLLNGYKSLSHIELISYLKKNCSDFTRGEIDLIDRLRIFRNRISYEGFGVPNFYLKENEGSYLKIIFKLRGLIKDE